MKFVTFEVPTLLGNISRAGALAQVGDGQVVLDLAHGYAALLQEEGAEPRFHEYADFRLPQDMCELMAGGEPSLKAARAAQEFILAKPARRGPNGGATHPSPFLKRGCAPRCRSPSRFVIF